MTKASITKASIIKELRGALKKVVASTEKYYNLHLDAGTGTRAKKLLRKAQDSYAKGEALYELIATLEKRVDI